MMMRLRNDGGRRQYGIVWFYRISIAGSLVLGAITLMGSSGFRVNLTPSKPLGLWRIVELDRPVRVGDLIFICPPQTTEMRDARERGYLRVGLCVGGTAPLIKTVAATSGQMIEIDDEVHIDGRSLPHSRIARLDGEGREIAPYAGGIVPPRNVYLHSDFPGSFDSRYFGPLPVDGVLGLAREVWTYAP